MRTSFWLLRELTPHRLQLLTRKKRFIHSWSMVFYCPMFVGGKVILTEWACDPYANALSLIWCEDQYRPKSNFICLESVWYTVWPWRHMIRINLLLWVFEKKHFILFWHQKSLDIICGNRYFRTVTIRFKLTVSICLRVLPVSVETIHQNKLVTIPIHCGNIVLVNCTNLPTFGLSRGK